MNYIMLNGRKIDLTEEQVEQIKSSCGIGQTKLADLNVGDTFKVGKYEFIVLEHSKETTAVILKDLLKEIVKFGENNKYTDTNCTVRKEVENFATDLENIVGKKNIVEHTVDLTSLDGLKDYGKTKAKVSLLTFERYRRYVDILDKHKVNKWWWLVTPFSTPKHNGESWVECVSPSGFVCNGNVSNLGGVRPFLRFVSSISVSRED